MLDPTTITGTDNVNYTALKVEVGGKVLAFMQQVRLHPKASILGFSTIKPGFNMSGTDIQVQALVSIMARQKRQKHYKLVVILFPFQTLLEVMLHLDQTVR